MRDKLNLFLNNAITFILLLVAGFTPLLFLNQTTEFFEIPKLVFLTFSTVLLLGLWIMSWIVRGKISISRTPLDFAMVLLLIAIIISAIVSPTRLVSIYGNFPRVHGSAVSWAIYIILFFITVSHLRSTKSIKHLIYVLMGSGVVISIVTLLSFFRLYIPVDFAKAVNFTPTGSSFATIAFLLMLLPLPIASLLNKNKFMPLPIAVAITLLFSLVVILIGSVTYVIVLALIFGACLLITNPRHIRSNMVYFVFPAAIITVVALLAYMPLSGPLGFLHNMENNFPKEIQLPLATSWKVSASSFRDAPIFGTGPSSYAFNFTQYKPVEFNNYPFWNFTFDSASNEFFHFLGTVGILGLGALLLIVVLILRSSKRNLVVRKHDSIESEESRVLLSGLTISAIVSVVLLGLHATTLVTIVTTFFILAAFLMSQRSVREKVTELSLGIKATSGNNKFDLFPVIIFILFLVAAVPFMTFVFKATAADYYHRQALNQSAKNGTLTYKYLQRAETLNPNISLYRIDMAQTNFALANALAVQKGPTEENPQGTLTDQEKQTIQTLLSQAINEGRVAVALNPRSAANWEVLGSIYRNITGVAQNALEFSLASYGQAIQRDPANPALRLSVGGIYYAGQNYPLASRFFSDAANLKADYPNAYYNLAITLRDSNDLTNSVLVAQQLVNMLNKDKNSADYKTAVTLHADLKSRLENQEKQQKAQQQAPAAQAESALQNPNLPNVTTLTNPPKVSPAPTVKPNPNTNLPSAASPTPTPEQ